MIDLETARHAEGMRIVGNDGHRIGKIEAIYVGDESGQPEFALVDTGLLGSSAFVPLQQADVSDDAITVPYDKDQVKDAPRLDSGKHLERADEERLFEYYGLDHGGQGSPGPEPQGGRTGAPHATSPADDEDHARRDEDDDAGADPDPATLPPPPASAAGAGQHLGADAGTGRGPRLRKYIVEEEVTITVPVRREEVRLEPEPGQDPDAGAAGQQLPISGDPQDRGRSS